MYRITLLFIYEGESNMNRNSALNSREVIQSPYPPIISWVWVFEVQKTIRSISSIDLVGRGTMSDHQSTSIDYAIYHQIFKVRERKTYNLLKFFKDGRYSLAKHAFKNRVYSCHKTFSTEKRTPAKFKSIFSTGKVLTFGLGL